MNDNQQPTNPNALSEEEAQTLFLQLRRKEGTWVDWGQTCQQLQKAGYAPAKIFEETGIEAKYQNLTIVAAQVFESIRVEGASEEVQNYFRGPRSDVLHEFRILNQKQRRTAAELAANKHLDVDDAHDVARAMKDFSRYSTPPEGFTDAPGDAMAYQCWKMARGKKDLQARSRLIARGLKFAHSPTAREQIERLLSDFTVVSSQRAPLLPLYRLEVEEELPRLIPVAGTLPLKSADLETVPPLEEIEPFRIVKFASSVTCVPVPGWQAILKAKNPIAILGKSDELPEPPSGKPEEVVIVVDRDSREWDANSYFLVDSEGELAIHWFPEAPDRRIIGRIAVILRPKKILDENNILEPWQMDD
ncbi:MAG: RuBisCO accumulation factor 1 [Cyanobacteria bacterium P01_E01_bin.42]